MRLSLAEGLFHKWRYIRYDIPSGERGKNRGRGNLRGLSVYCKLIIIRFHKLQILGELLLFSNS